MKRNNKRKDNYTIIKALLVVTVAVAIVFSFYVSIELFEHECTGDDCPVCNFIFVCRAMQKMHGIDILLGCCVAVLFFIVKSFFSKRERGAFSPVRSNVRLNC